MSRRRWHEFWEEGFAEQARQLRQERGWSLKDVVEKLAAEGFEMSVSNYSKLETAQKPIRIAEAAAVSAVFGLPPLSMFYGPAEDDQPEEIQELQKALLRAQKALDSAESSLDSAGFSYTTRYKEVREAAAKLIAARSTRHELPRESNEEFLARVDDQLDEYERRDLPTRPAYTITPPEERDAPPA